jgi:hypothetical protein
MSGSEGGRAQRCARPTRRPILRGQATATRRRPAPAKLVHWSSAVVSEKTEPLERKRETKAKKRSEQPRETKSIRDRRDYLIGPRPGAARKFQIGFVNVA